MSNKLGVRRVEDIADPVDREMAYIREASVGREFDTDVLAPERLEDVEGIGPATAKKLKEAGIEKPRQLARVTHSQLEAVEGIGPKTADAIGLKFNYRRDARFDAPETPPEVSEAMASRSAVARLTDRSSNAPITLDPDEWLDNMARLDFPGVDTIPEQRRAKRVREIARQAPVRIASGDLPEGVSGRLSGGLAKVSTYESFDPVSSLAHEIGHAVDFERGDSTGLLSDDFFDEELREEAKTLAVRRRPMVRSPESIEEAYADRDFDAELFADAFASATEEPAATRRIAPNLFRKLQNEFVLEYGRF